MAKLKQEDRLFYLDTPLGPDKLLVRSFNVKESMCEPFHAELDMVSDDHEIKYDDILGKPVTCAIMLSDESNKRYFHGIVTNFRQKRNEGRLAVYEADVRPWYWLLTLTQDCAVHQNESVPQIVEKIFRKFGFTDFENRLTKNYPAWEFCLQYRESSFAFLSRLLEAEGIFYFFKQEAGKHKLIMGDKSTVHEDCPVQSKFRFERSYGPGAKHEDDTVFEWDPQVQMRPGKITHKEWNSETPWKALLSQSQTSKDRAGAEYEIYEFPGEFEEQGEGDNWVKDRQEELDADYHIIRGQSNCRALTPGYRFELEDHIRADQNGKYIVTSVVHSGHEGAFLPGIGSGSPTYRNSFVCIPEDVPYRPRRKTKKHRMHGAQTAIVTGPGGEEIYTDELGRVKVQFHWDREGKRNEDSSCWLRVMQQWTGPNYGSIWIPRIGQEVVVDFYEGDPDRPVIVGCIYNKDNMPPYALPGNKTRSGVKTRSSKGGGGGNANELRFEDKKGEELVYLHAEKDFDMHVENDSMRLVERNDHHTVDGSHYITVGGESHHKITKGREDSVGKDYLIDAGGQIHLKAGSKIILDAPEIGLKGLGGSIKVDSMGVTILGTMVKINSGGAPPAPGKPSSPKSAKKPDPPA